MRLSSRVAITTCFLLLASAGCLAADDRENAWSTLKQGLANTNVDKRSKAVSDLALLPGDPQAFDAALTALKDPKPEVRATAAQALGELSDKKAIPELKEGLKDTDPSVLLAVARALISLGDDEGYDVFYAVLTGQQKPGSSLLDQQKKVLSDPKKLAGLGFETGIGFVPFGGMALSAYKLFTKDETSPVLAGAALALAKDPDPKSGDALADAALNQKKWLVRAAAFQAIAKRGDPVLKHTAILGLQDDQDEVQYAAAAAVIRLSDIESGRGEKPKPVKRPRHTAPPKQ